MSATELNGEALVDLERRVVMLLEAGEREQVRETVEVLDVWQPADRAALQRGVAILDKAGLAGRALVVVQRFCERFPTDVDAQLDAVEIRVKQGSRKENASLIEALAAIAPKTGTQRLRVGSLWRRMGRFDLAATAFEEAADAMPDSLEAHQQWVEAANFSGQQALARRALARLAKVAPPWPFWLAFTAEHYVRAGDLKAFRKAAVAAAANLPPDEGAAIVVLARAFSLCGDGRGVERVLRVISLPRISSEWVLKTALDLSVRHAPTLRLDIARRIVQVPKMDAVVLRECELIIAGYRSFGR